MPQEMKSLSIKPLSGAVDFFQADPSLESELLFLRDDPGLVRKLKAVSPQVSGIWDRLASEAALNYDGPKLLKYDGTGNRIDRVWLPPPVRVLREQVVAAGVLSPSSRLEQSAFAYLLSHLGEASLVCPLACTVGLIQVVEAAGSDFLKSFYLPKLRSLETPLACAQFVTEKDLGSDVGALQTRAVPDGEGRWKLWGEKWFCSAIDEYFLIAARPEGAPEGTRGVGIFLVPKTIDGALNEVHIKRLKNKIRDRGFPTAEIDLAGAAGFNIGPVEKGFPNLMNHVINTSRVLNAAAALGFAARAYLEAENYVRQRSVFGKKMREWPLVREALAKIQCKLSASRALSFYGVSEASIAIRRPILNPTTPSGSAF